MKDLFQTAGRLAASARRIACVGLAALALGAAANASAQQYPERPVR